MVLFTTLVNFRLLSGGQIHEGLQLVISPETGTVLKRTGYIGGDIVDLEDAIIAPGFLECQVNGWAGVHFTELGKDSGEEATGKLEKVANELVKRGVTGFWATVPTVGKEEYEKILPHLTPQQFPNGATLLGAHLEGPYLSPSKAGAHNPSSFLNPSFSSPETTYTSFALTSTAKLVTLAPELPHSTSLIQSLIQKNIRVSLGHSSATYSQGEAALQAGATCLTHVFNAMSPLHHREPGLAGLMTGKESPYFSIIADGIHLHPATIALAYRANPEKCLLVSDAVELAGLEDGTYPGNAQIPHQQTKKGSRVTIAGTDTLIGSTCGLDECVRNLVKFAGCDVSEAVRCVTENAATFMGVEQERGFLTEGRQADFVVLSDDGEVLQTWLRAEKVWDSGRPLY